jgi:hypothetical protein
MSVSNCTRVAGPLLVLWVAACDPIGPGAAGQVHVAEGTNYQGLSLELRAYADDGAPFDPAALQITDAAMARNTISLDTPPPWDYLVGEPVGSTSRPHWRVVAWLSTEDGTDGDRMPSGALYGTTTFDVADCGFPVSGYCEHTDNVDIVLDQRVPE